MIGPPHIPEPLARARDEFRHWLGVAYDLQVMEAVLAAAATDSLQGDRTWLLVIGGSGNAKTETVSTLAKAGAIITSTITSEGALLSGTPAREKGKEATGGLLRRVGNRGVLVVKDVTSILSMNRDSRAGVLAGLREVYDGHWERNIGTDGGRSLLWTGNVTVIGAVTTAWDRAHEVIASMGDRFIVVRMNSTDGRLESGRQALRNTGQESTMRDQLGKAVARVLAAVDASAGGGPTDDEVDRLLTAANLVTLCRTAVDYDARGNVIDAHAHEAPTRFAKQLLQLLRGGCAIGLQRAEALALAIRCARDSMPPLRLAIIEDLARHPLSRTSDVRRRIDKPHNTVDRQLQALHMLGAVTVEERQHDQRTSWHYSLAECIDPSALFPEMSPNHRSEEIGGGLTAPSTDISGNGVEGCHERFS